MNYELELTKANRLEVARAFRFSKRVDFSIECAIEGQLGKVFWLMILPSRPPIAFGLGHLGILREKPGRPAHPGRAERCVLRIPFG